MKLLVVTNLFHPDQNGGASVFSDLCYRLVERGYDVTVYTAYPYYPEWRNKAGARLWRVAQEVTQGVHVRRFGMYLPKNPSKLLPRVFFELSFTFSLLRSLFYFRRFDVVMLYCPLMGAVAYGAVRNLFYREPTWLNVQDIPADAAAASGISKSHFTKVLGQYAQAMLFNRANVWSTIAPKMIDRLMTLRRRNQPIHFVPNFLHGSMAKIIASHPAKVGRPPGNPFKLLYLGSIGKKQHLLTFCERLYHSDFDFSFKIHGDGGEAVRVREWVRSRKDRRFQLGQFLDEQGFVSALYDSDMLVITETPGVGSSFIPSRLIPAITTGTPVACVCDIDGPLGREVREYGLGVAVDWEAFPDFLGRLNELLSDSAAFVKLQNACIARSLAYAREPVVDSVERHLSEMLP